MADEILNEVKRRYAAVAESGLSGSHSSIKAVAESFGYSAADLAAIPEAANMGLSCGNPTALAALKPGEVVVDLGCGGGMDVFLAAAKVGSLGKAIGIDMTASMIDRARHNAAHGPHGRPYENVEFILSTIDNTTLPPDTADCVISNCVLNLAPDKPAVMREMFRILKPGGRLAISDIALKKPLPDALAADLAAYAACIAGAVLLQVYRDHLADAGFADITIVDSHADLNAYSGAQDAAACCSPAKAPPNATSPVTQSQRQSRLSIASSGCCGSSQAVKPLHADIAELLRRYDVNEYAASVKIYAVKPIGQPAG
ncbi:MAG: arsenite methyltransferase [Phycisphaerae bacterium]